ncbi:hypothetical protein [Micromonospora sediminimaris]|uniref:Uncharacterized protein n=1 Tax=Micromonospora sediminimaris TaxID=547162 RepID=A0A9W5URF9_9ACTN|nr:hypothetical protein [Micromonospora sediminimaris]GIJ33234.1 hypothetical protein Vse01_23820 [Micromonospora sediminimaris]SFC07405.1 hypothetical protein SAMN05216284_102414 [Micromonospora sediminimaris]
MLLTDRFPDLRADLDSAPDRVEITVKASGQVGVNGWAQLEVLDGLLESVGRPVRGG